MNLTIDEGNSSAKVSVFEGNDMVAVARFDLLSISALARIIKIYNVKAAAYSSVRRPDARIIELLRKRVKKFICLDHNTPLPVTVDYDTPRTLGQDRIAAAVGATIFAPEQNSSNKLPYKESIPDEIALKSIPNQSIYAIPLSYAASISLSRYNANALFSLPKLSFILFSELFPRFPL